MFLVLGLTAVIYFLSLSRSAEVVILATQDPKRSALAQSVDEYKEAAAATLGASLANTNKITIDSGEVRRELKKKFPELEQVSLQLSLFNRSPKIYILPAEAALLVRSGNDVVVVDSSGRVVADVRRLKNPARLDLHTVEDKAGLPVELGEVTLPEHDVAFVTEVIGQLKSKKLEIESLVLPVGGGQLDLRVKGIPYIVKFNLKGDARAEAGAYLAVKARLESEGKTPAQYVDVRVDNRVYYR
jgi:hypothetical protein